MLAAPKLVTGLPSSRLWYIDNHGTFPATQADLRQGSEWGEEFVTGGHFSIGMRYDDTVSPRTPQPIPPWPPVPGV